MTSCRSGSEASGSTPADAAEPTTAMVEARLRRLGRGGSKCHCASSGLNSDKSQISSPAPLYPFRISRRQSGYGRPFHGVSALSCPYLEFDPAIIDKRQVYRLSPARSCRGRSAGPRRSAPEGVTNLRRFRLHGGLRCPADDFATIARNPDGSESTRWKNVRATGGVLRQRRHTPVVDRDGGFGQRLPRRRIRVRQDRPHADTT